MPGADSLVRMIRRVVLWRWRDGVTADERLAAKEGLAYVSFGSPSVAAFDFGEDLGLRGDGNYGLVMIRDHADLAAWVVYDGDPHHFRVGAFIDTLTHEELTARADYVYEGPTPERGAVRHVSLWSWREGVSASEQAAARDELVAGWVEIPGLDGLVVADDLGWAGEGRADLVVEAHFPGEREAAGFLAHAARAAGEARLELATDPSRTARAEHRVRSG
jgi:hypothetical protein